MGEHELTLSVPAAGRRLGIGKNLSYAAARRGELPVLRFGRKLRVPLAALVKPLQDSTTPRRPQIDPRGTRETHPRLRREAGTKRVSTPITNRAAVEEEFRLCEAAHV
jgi:excisionase family DNA binding protein